jgi:hypothetical protein
MDKQKPEQKAFANRTEAPRRRKRNRQNVGVVVVVGSHRKEKKSHKRKINREDNPEYFTKTLMEHRYNKLHASENSLFDIEANYPRIASALREVPSSFGICMLNGLYLTRRTWHGIQVNHLRGAKTSYVHNLLKRLEKSGTSLSPEAVEIMKIAELQGGFVTWDTMLKGLTLRLQLEARAQKEAQESERNAILDRLHKVGDLVQAGDLELVEVFTTHRPCKTQITRAWCHKTRPRAPSNDFAWALCPKCKVVLSLSQAELKPTLTP